MTAQPPLMVQPPPQPQQPTAVQQPMINQQTPSQPPQSLPSLSQQQRMDLDSIASEITTIRIALTSIELAIKKVKQ